MTRQIPGLRQAAHPGMTLHRQIGCAIQRKMRLIRPGRSARRNCSGAASSAAMQR
jgi:hypothetical protein